MSPKDGDVQHAGDCYGHDCPVAEAKAKLAEPGCAPESPLEALVENNKEEILQNVLDLGPWDWTLRFVDPTLEAAYWDSRVRKNLWFVDGCSHCNCALMATSMLAKLSQTAAPLLVVGIVTPAWILFRALLAFWSFSRSTSYIEWRTAVIMAVRLAFVYVGSLAGVWMEPPESSPGVVCLRIISGSMVIGLVATSVGLQVKSTVNIGGQFIVTALTAAMTPGYCLAGFGHSRFRSAFQSLGSSIDAALRSPAMGAVAMAAPAQEEAGQPHNYSCWMVVTYLQWTVGFFLTSLVVHCIEGWSRMKYASWALDGGPKLERQLRKYLLGSVFTALGVACIGSMICWEVLKMIESVGSEPNCPPHLDRGL